MLAVPLILIEATGFALLNPALYAVVAANSPPGRSSTAQGLFGAAGTLGFIVASLAAGVLAAQSILYPFYVFSAVMVVSLVVGLVDRRTDAARTGRRPRAIGASADSSCGRLAFDPNRARDRLSVSRRGVEQRQLVGLITRRSLVRIQSPQPTPFPEPRVPTNPGFFLVQRQRVGLVARGQGSSASRNRRLFLNPGPTNPGHLSGCRTCSSYRRSAASWAPSSGRQVLRRSSGRRRDLESIVADVLGDFQMDRPSGDQFHPR